MVQDTMSQIEMLKTDQISAFLRQAAQDCLAGTFSCLCSGKWSIFDMVILVADENEIQVQLISGKNTAATLKKDQPVGICFQYDYSKYLFESTISVPPSLDSNGRLCMDWPDKIEKMQRRAYERQPIPAGLNVRAMFWHRGHLHETDTAPHEDYWQGKIENLSAGGAMIRVDRALQDCFSIGQLVGVQFTPMSYQKPLLLEGHIRHLKTPSDLNALLVGVEFLGLEASPEGREILHRLLEVIDAYEKMSL